MFLVDTTVWIDYFRGNDTAQVKYLTSALEADQDICICGPVLTEILQGITDEEQFVKTKKFLGFLIYLPLSESNFLLSAEIYRSSRSKGKSVRKTIDCFIASCAITHKIPLLHTDEDYVIIEKYSQLKCLKV